MIRIFGVSVVVTLIAMVAAYLYGGTTELGGLQALFLVVILGVLEVSLSFDNAVINASVLRRMSAFWQRMFLTVGIVVAVFGMRLAFPLLLVWATTSPRLGPIAALRLALNPPTDGRPTYESIIRDAHPQIAAFGGMFLLMLFLDYFFTEKDRTWITLIERPLERVGQIGRISVIVSLGVLVYVATAVAPDAKAGTVLLSGVLGLLTYLIVNGLSSFFHIDESGDDAAPGGAAVVVATGRAAFMLFLYLEILDASFSFDGVIGAFAITSDPIIIALGLGLIGAMFVRSLTVYMVRRGTLDQYVYLEHGAHWAIGALAGLLLVSIGHHVDELVTGLAGMVFIAAAFAWSVRFRKKESAEPSP
ncbi:DUF475 domain-containing protein [Gordonia sp. X0973]|uniref:DUF475 domain-containing protein n=1 Tax=Gordonia sp. X0973 TaxID=2742602 RepID=UPI000F5213C2|nr:DUF475 domain-containing protein [Gordonia sp. X0973]QKT08691.1 DUF475 domain-containing protein [Gordonia sp. X0973]